MASTRIPLNTFAIGFGLAGLAEAWSAAIGTLGVPGPIAQSFWLVAAVAWCWLVVAHLVRGARSDETLSMQLRHPAQGPIAALVPTTGMLLSGDLLTVSRTAGLILFLVFALTATVFAAWLIGTWLQDGLSLESMHGGYLLPTVAAALVGADVAAQCGLRSLGFGMLAAGIFFWVAVTTLLLARFAFRPSLPDPLVPTMAVLVAPPAVGGIAWFSLVGVHDGDPVGAMFAGLGVLLLAVQIALVPKYRRIAFSLGFWSFTFPAGAVITDALIWLRFTADPVRSTLSVILLAAVTALIVAIAAKSVLALR